MYAPLLGRFLSPDTLVPRPDDPQSFNRHSYARHSPLVRIDPSGHADKSPCEENPSLPFCFPSTPPLLNEQQAGQALAAQQAPVTLNNGTQITLLAAKRSNDGNKDRGSSGLGALVSSLFRRLLGSGGGAGAGKMAQELSRDGDPANEMRGLGSGANTFAEGFSRAERRLVQSLVRQIGFENKGVTFWRGEGAPEAYRASAATDKPYITIFDGFFKLSRQQQLKVLREEMNHLQQNIQMLSDELIQHYERQAKGGQ
jgi:hypothetical protein